MSARAGVGHGHDCAGPYFAYLLHNGVPGVWEDDVRGRQQSDSSDGCGGLVQPPGEICTARLWKDWSVESDAFSSPRLCPQIFMLLWSYFAAVLTEPGRVPPGWQPSEADEEVLLAGAKYGCRLFMLRETFLNSGAGYRRGRGLEGYSEGGGS